MPKRQGKGDYRGGSTVISSDFGFSRLLSDLGFKPRASKRTPLAKAAAKRSETIKAKLRKPKRHRKLRTPFYGTRS
jgi:hypothetical protein